jgi:hypothetical protein
MLITCPYDLRVLVLIFLAFFYCELLLNGEKTHSLGVVLHGIHVCYVFTYQYNLLFCDGAVRPY